MAAPLWGALADWNEAVRTMNHLVRLHHIGLNRATAEAREIFVQLSSMFPLLDDLCSQTCPRCPSPCCLTAKVWIDFRDLLFLNLSNRKPPPNPLIENLKGTCRYSSRSGCTLPRIIRPWTCTWYLCPPQVANLRGKPRSVRDAFSRAVASVKAGRKKMDAEFIRVVS